MAATPIPIRSVTKNITPNGANYVLLDDGVAMGKASLTDAVTTVAGPLADTKIAALNLDTASTHPATDFATAAQGTKADSAIQPSAIGDSVQAHSNRLQSLTDATGVEGQVPNLKADGTFELADAGSGDMRKNVFDPNGKEADAFDQDNMVDGTTNKNYTATEKTKLADAVTKSDTSTAAMGFVLDEDDFTSNSATKLPTQASTKAYVDTGLSLKAADPVTPDFTDAVPVALKLITQDHVSPAWFGLTGGSTEDLAYTRALTAAIEDNKPALVEADHTLDVIDMSGVAAGGSLRIRHTGKLTQVGASSADMFNLGTRDEVELVGPGEFDGQKDSQTANRIIIPVANVDRFHARGLIFRNVKRGAVHQQNPLATSFILEDFACYEGGLHNGVTNDLSCEFVLIRSGLYARVSRFRMIQTADPAANTNRNPAGIFYINSGSSPGSGQVVIEDGYLENLGYSSASNHVGMVDFYNRAEKIDLKRLTFRKSRFLPIRTNYAKIVSVSQCDVEVPSQMYYNDTTLYSDAAAYTCGMVDRSYATDGGHTEQVTIEKCVALISGNHNCRAVSAVGGDNDYLFKKLVLDTNNFQHTGTNSSAGVFTSVVVDVEEIAPTTEGFDLGTRTQGTSTVGTAAASETNAVYRRTGGRTKGGSNGLYARDNVANLNVTLEDASMSGQSSSSYTVRTAKNVRVERNTLPNPGDTSSNAAFWFRDNNAGGAADPTGYTTNTYYHLRDNVGRADV